MERKMRGNLHFRVEQGKAGDNFKRLPIADDNGRKRRNAKE